MVGDKIKNWWNERDDVDKLVIIFAGGVITSSVLGFAAGKHVAKKKAKLELEAKNATIDHLSSMNTYSYMPPYPAMGPAVSYALPSWVDHSAPPIETVDELESCFNAIISDLRKHQDC